MAVDVVGITWYHRKDYLRLREMFVDGRVFPDTFDRWLKTAQETYDMAKAAGGRRP